MLLQLSDEDENRLFGDFVWAIESLPETRSLATTALRPGGPPLGTVSSVIRQRLDASVASTDYDLDSFEPVSVALDPTFLRLPQAYSAYLRWLDIYGLSLELEPEDLLSPRVDTLFAADGSPTAPGYLETITYRLMHASFLGTMFGLPATWSILRILLLRGSLNRQLAIMHFLRHLPPASADPRGSEIPSKSSVIATVHEWPPVDALVREDLALQLLEEYRYRWGQNVQPFAHA